MTFQFNVPGKKRKELAQSISAWLNEPMSYRGAPSFSYEVSGVIIDKNGSMSFADTMDEALVERLLEHLYDEGFESEMQPASDGETGLCISVPRALFTDEALNNLKLIIAAKCGLIRKALGVSDLPIDTDEEKFSFLWFSGDRSSEEINAYKKLVCALCDMAKNQKRINVTDHAVENERYAFRCFLLRLGFIGDEYKTARKILLSNLEGSSAFKMVKAEGENDE